MKFETTTTHDNGEYTDHIETGSMNEAISMVENRKSYDIDWTVTDVMAHGVATVKTFGGSIHQVSHTIEAK